MEAAVITGVVAFTLGWAFSTFNVWHNRTRYDATAEQAELWAESVAAKVAAKLGQKGK